MSKILVIRFSAIGDVAMTVPVVYSLAKQYPGHQITVLSKKSLQAFFEEAPDNVRFWGADLSGMHKGLLGMNRLYKALLKERFDYVIDLNGVLRSLFLSIRFAVRGKSVSVVSKEKWKQRRLTRKKNKLMKPLPTTFERYKKAFSILGFSFSFDFDSIFEGKVKELTEIESEFGYKGAMKWVGIAPFAKHQEKTYPLELQEQVVAYLSRDERVRLFLFGGGEKEKAVLDGWAAKYPRVESVVGKLHMSKELKLINGLDLMVSMDSANMHFASLVGLPVVSVWGATHPYSGFLGWGQKKENVVQIPLECRPCSPHGTKPCYKHTWECMYGIRPSMIIERIESVLHLSDVSNEKI